MIVNVVEVLKGIGVLCIVDGGVCFLGDVLKVFVVGVNVVMMGSMFVGIEEVLGDVFLY